MSNVVGRLVGVDSLLSSGTAISFVGTLLLNEQFKPLDMERFLVKLSLRRFIPRRFTSKGAASTSNKWNSFLFIPSINALNVWLNFSSERVVGEWVVVKYSISTTNLFQARSSGFEAREHLNWLSPSAMDDE